MTDSPSRIAPDEVAALRECSSQLITLAAAAVRADGFISSFAEDNPKSTPVSVLRKAESQEDILRETGLKLRNIADKIRDVATRLSAATPVQPATREWIPVGERLPDDVTRIACMLRQWSDDDCEKCLQETGRLINKDATLGYIAARMLESLFAATADK